MAVSKRLVLKFPQRLTDRPIIFRLAKDYDLEFSILKASISPDREGLMVLELKGKQEEYDRGIDFLLKTGVKIQALSQDVIRNEDKCINCGACVAVCPTGAFKVQPDNRLVIFDNEKCIACEACIPACPPRAMEVHF